jgi:putative flippase GtrA
LLRKFARYFVTGGLAAIVDAGGFALLIWAGVPVWLAAILSFLAAAVVNYLTTAAFVFQQPPSVRHFLLFLMTASVGLLLNVGVTLAAAHLLACPAVLAKILGIACAFTLNFMMNVLLVFRART